MSLISVRTLIGLGFVVALALPFLDKITYNTGNADWLEVVFFYASTLLFLIVAFFILGLMIAIAG